MKAILVAMALFLGAPFASAQSNDEGGIVTSPIEGAQLRCQLFADGQDFEYVFNHTDQRVWFTELGGVEGFELQIASYSAARCPGCFVIKASFLDGDHDISLSRTSAAESKMSMITSYDGEDGKRVQERLEATCK